MKIALVTGGTRGIGKAIALKLKNDGYKVIVTYGSNQAEAGLLKEEHQIECIQCDVSSYEQSQNMAQKIQTDHGNPSVIIHNAGITQDAFFHKMTLDQWNAVISTNLSSCFNTIHPFITNMRDQKHGRIIIISSINALKGQIGQTNYCAAKAGIIGFVKALALENANKNITVNAIAPGYIETEMTQKINPKIIESIKTQIPMGRFGHVDEIAHTVSFLCNEKSDFITGETINVNGGHHLH